MPDYLSSSQSLPSLQQDLSQVINTASIDSDPPSPKKDGDIDPAAAASLAGSNDFMPKIGEGGEVKMLLTWQAPSRPYRPKDRSYYTTVAVIVTLLVLISLLAQEIILIGVLLAIAFVAFVLAYVPPHEVTYKLSTQGVTIADHFYFWHELDSFWFKETDGHKLMIIQTLLRFPAQLMVVLGDQGEEGVKKVVARFLPFHEIPYRSVIDKWAEKLQKHFPLENTHR